ncbi:MAG: hypothetical protein H7X89_00075 [Rhizobiales bacterium]|nr:hypothetical protein [Hyphomicrobiales bacterium]
MLSLVLYGRNDTHGYNLHKRAAISLNCMAQMLVDDDDEIIFVDYNTPDDLPTFPEAIRDTLTPRARRFLRILRVRPADHEPWRHLTHLQVCETVARNAGIRRANGANPWILSTNTDMIFVPRQSDRSLTDMVDGLPARCHHLPRFELPQTLWEEFDRADPAAIMAHLGEFGSRLHLDEIVHGSDPARFDNHGDFQLLPRAALAAINGFDERMLNGWIVDSNMARRMMLHLGPPASLDADLAGYHCDHTRIGGVFHGRDHLENDYRRFYEWVERADLPHQASSWGLAEREIEEIRLAERPPGLTRLLAAVLPPPTGQAVVSNNRPDLPDVSAYSPEHAVPFIADLLATLPRNARIAWFGTRPRLLELMVAIHGAMGFTVPLVVAAECGLAVAGTHNVPAAVALAEADADMVIFEFGRATQDAALDGDETGWSNADLDAVAPVRAGFLAMVELERKAIAGGARPRPVVTVNAIHNRFEPLVHETLSVARSPFSSRVRHGAVRPDSSPLLRLSAVDLGPWLQRRMGRPQPVPVTEAVRLLTLAQLLLSDEGTPEQFLLACRAAEAMLAVLEFPPVAALGSAAMLRDRIQSERGATRFRDRLRLPLTDAIPSPMDAPCRLACAEDWEASDWIAPARKFLGGAFAGNLFRRSTAIWVAGQILAIAGREGTFGPGKRALLSPGAPECLPEILSEHMADIHVLAGPQPRPVSAVMRVPSRLDLSRSAPDNGLYHLIQLDDWAALADAAPRLSPGGLLVVVAPVALDAALQPHIQADSFGLEILPAAPMEVTRTTLDLMVGNDMVLPATWFFRRSRG